MDYKPFWFAISVAAVTTVVAIFFKLIPEALAVSSLAFALTPT